MKKIMIVLSLIVGFADLRLHAQISFTPAQKQTLRDTATRRLTNESYHMDGTADDLSILVYRASNHNQRTNIKKDLDSIKYDYYSMAGEKKSLSKSLNAQETAKLNSMMKHLFWRMALLVKNLTNFSNYGSNELYAAQIDYAEDEIDRFLAITDSFRQFLNGLKVTTQENQLKIIRDTISLIKIDVASNASKLTQLPVSIGRQLSPVKKTVDSIKRIADTIKGMLRRDTVNYQQYALLSAYSDDIFGLSYFHRIGNHLPVLSGNYWGAEIIVPASSTASRNPGGFLFYGLRDDKLFIQAGIGYLKKQYQ